MTIESGLPQTLRALRRERGLSLGEAAYRAGLSVNSLQGWESGRQSPKGSSLARLLDALEAPERTRARLLADTAPRFARAALAKSRLGPPLSMGTVLKAMRVRRGATQRDVARTLGVTQGTIARWEAGDMVPSAGTLHEAAFALGATAEEAVALASAQGGLPDGLPDEPGPVSLPGGLSAGLREVVAMGYEAELWRRAAVNARWEAALSGLFAQRANLYAALGRFAEVSALADRALRLATTPESREAATPAVNALSELSLHRGESPLAAARTCGEWGSRLSAPSFRAWMLGNQGLYLIRAGRREEGIEAASLACDVDAEDARYAALAPGHETIMRAQSMGNAYAQAKMAEAAAEALAAGRHAEFDQHLFAEVEHANDRPLDPASLAYLRHRTLRVPESISLKGIESLERIERKQARLTGGSPAPVVVDPAPDAETAQAEARRLWAAVPGGLPWAL